MVLEAQWLDMMGIEHYLTGSGALVLRGLTGYYRRFLS